MAVFLLNLAHANFADGKGPYPVTVGGNLRMVWLVMKVALVLGLLGTLIAAALYFIHLSAVSQLEASERTVTATVTGCEGPGRYQNIRFHYTVNGKTYVQNPYWHKTVFVGPSGMTDACASPSGAIQLKYLAGDPNRWSISPLSPLTREDRTSGPAEFVFIPGPTLLFIGGIFGAVGWALQKTKLREERLGREGVLLPAVLIQAKEETNDESGYTIRCEYRFTTPAGRIVTGKTSGARQDLKKQDFPPPGTEMKVLYVDDDLYEAI